MAELIICSQSQPKEESWPKIFTEVWGNEKEQMIRYLKIVYVENHRGCTESSEGNEGPSTHRNEEKKIILDVSVPGYQTLSDHRYDLTILILLLVVVEKALSTK